MIQNPKTNSERLLNYLEAEAAVLQGQTIVFHGRTLTRANLELIQKEIRRLELDIIREGNLGPKIGGLRYKVANLS